MKSGLFAMVLPMVLLGVSCATTSPSGPSFAESRVIQRIGNATETPKWANGEEAMKVENNDVVFIHVTSMGGDSRPDACLKVAEVEGRTAFMKHIKEGISNSGQINEENASSDPSYESLTAFLSQGHISGARTTARYWEKREESAADGTRVLRLSCAVKTAIKKTELESQLKKAMGKGGNKEIREQLLKAQKEFLSSAGSEAAPASASREATEAPVSSEE